MILTIIFICLTVLGLIIQYLQLRKKETIIKNYKNKENNIHNETQQIMNSPIFINLPADVKGKLNYISSTTGSSISFVTFNDSAEDKTQKDTKEK